MIEVFFFSRYIYHMKLVIYLSFATAAIAFTVTETQLFKSLREWLNKKNRLLGELFTCGYCFGYWVAFALVAIYKPRLFHYWWLLDYFLTAIVIAWFSAFQWLLLCWLMEKAEK
jgi:Protein of unknown function (DUF1360)